MREKQNSNNRTIRDDRGTLIYSCDHDFGQGTRAAGAPLPLKISNERKSNFFAGSADSHPESPPKPVSPAEHKRNGQPALPAVSNIRGVEVVPG